MHFAGQEGDKTNYTAAAKRTVDHILSYMRTFPSWAYNGASRSWGDLGNNGKWMISKSTASNFQTRGNFHYRSGLNQIPREFGVGWGGVWVGGGGGGEGGRRERGGGGGEGREREREGGRERDRTRAHHIPAVIEWYRANPDDLLLLRIAMGAQAGQLVRRAVVLPPISSSLRHTHPSPPLPPSRLALLLPPPPHPHPHPAFPLYRQTCIRKPEPPP